jgi:hypothetical protein
MLFPYAFQEQRPFLVVLPNTLTRPGVWLSKSVTNAVVKVTVENRGKHFAQHSTFSARLIYPNTLSIDPKTEIQKECQHPSIYASIEGTASPL